MNTVNFPYILNQITLISYIIYIVNTVSLSLQTEIMINDSRSLSSPASSRAPNLTPDSAIKWQMTPRVVAIPGFCSAVAIYSVVEQLER